MPNTSRSSVAVRTVGRPSGVAGIIRDFSEEAKDADQWTPEERKAKVGACVDRFIAHDMESIAETSRRIQQEIIHTGAVGVTLDAPVLPAEKKLTAKQLVDKVAASIQFG